MRCQHLYEEVMLVAGRDRCEILRYSKKRLSVRGKASPDQRNTFASPEQLVVEVVASSSHPPLDGRGRQGSGGEHK